MKKILTVLVISLLVLVSLFSEELNESSIVLTTVVAELKNYEFSLIELSPEPNYNYNAAQTGTADFKITSNTVVNFASIPDLIEITITVGPWIMVGETVGSNEVTLKTETLSSSNSRVTVNGTNGFSVNFTSGYNATFEIGNFSVGWSESPTLAAGEYTSDIQISYTQI